MNELEEATKQMRKFPEGVLPHEDGRGAGLQSYREDLDAYDKLLADMLEENVARLEHYDTTPYADQIVREMRDYRCSRCHFHATDHDSFCRECGARFIR